MDKRITTGLVANALKMAIWRHRPAARLIFHSDRSSLCCSNSSQKLLYDNRIRSCMSRKGDCWDNSVAENFSGSLKTEWGPDTVYPSREEARQDIVDYIEMFYNSKRHHSYLGFLSPVEFEEMTIFDKVA